MIIDQNLQWLLGIIICFIFIPWILWISSSIVSHKTEIAVLKSVLESLNDTLSKINDKLEV